MGREIPLKVVKAELAKSFCTVTMITAGERELSVVVLANESHGSYYISFTAMIDGKEQITSQRLGSGEEGLRKAHRALRDEYLIRNGALALIESVLGIDSEE